MPARWQRRVWGKPFPTLFSKQNEKWWRNGQDTVKWKTWNRLVHDASMTMQESKIMLLSLHSIKFYKIEHSTAHMCHTNVGQSMPSGSWFAKVINGAAHHFVFESLNLLRAQWRMNFTKSNWCILQNHSIFNLNEASTIRFICPRCFIKFLSAGSCGDVGRLCYWNKSSSITWNERSTKGLRK